MCPNCDLTPSPISYGPSMGNHHVAAGRTGDARYGRLEEAPRCARR